MSGGFLFSGNEPKKEGGSIVEVEVRHGDIEDAIKLFKRQMTKDGILKELKFRRSYEKPSVKKKRKQLEAQRRRLKEERKRQRS